MVKASKIFLLLFLLIFACKESEPDLNLTKEAILGTWSGEKFVPNLDGSEFDAILNQTITFHTNDVYSSNIPREGTTVEGTYVIIGGSILISVPPVTNNSHALHLENVSIESNTLTFVIDSNPTATGYQPFRGVYYKLIKQD
jgi:hypothetical protein